MKNLLVFATLLILASCGRVESPEEFFDITGDTGESCHTETVEGGVNIVCGDDVAFVSNGTDGADGKDGQNGKDGVDGQDGKDGLDGQDGKDGIDGVDGVDGQDGADGTFEGTIEYVEICPEVLGSYIETIMYLNGEYLAFLSSSNYRRQRLVILPEGVTFKTTDGRNVRFKIQNGEILCE